jgi:predicted secreted protein with PEFG-CTERM motif
MNYNILFVFFLVISTVPIYAQSTKDSDVDKSALYKLEIIEHVYSVPYAVDAVILAMAIDPESRSLLIGLKNTQDSKFVIDLKHELINAQNNDFVILADGKEINYQIAPDSDSSRFTFFIPEFTEEVEIIGTHVIPEFPLGIMLIFGVMISSIVIFAKTKTLFFK